MAEEVRLSVTDNGREVSMEFNNLIELSDLLHAAGVDQSHEIDTDDNGAFDVDVDSDGAISITDENADFDYGNNPTSHKGFEYDIDPYKYQGDAELDVRYTPAKSADNPLPYIREGKGFVTYLKEVEDKKSKKLKRK